jgi:hypothetical protein
MPSAREAGAVEPGAAQLPDGGAAGQLRVLSVRRDDSPRWHLHAADEAIEDGRLDVAREALARARANAAGDPGVVAEARFVALRLALASVELRKATDEVLGLVAENDPGDPVWNRRVRRMIESAPATVPDSVRDGLLDLLPELPGAPAALPASGLPALPDDPRETLATEREESDQGSAGVDHRPVPASDPFAAVPDADSDRDAPEEAEVEVEVEAEVEVVMLDLDSDPPVPAGGSFDGRLRVSGGNGDELTDAERLRDRLVDEMLATIPEEEARLLFESATTFLNNGDPATAAVIFSSVMRVPEFRVAACEGFMQALVQDGRCDEAAVTASRAERVYATEGAAILGIVYWHGVAAQHQGDKATALLCFSRVLSDPSARSCFVDLDSRIAEVS